jgi:hypothetical protein
LTARRRPRARHLTAAAAITVGAVAAAVALGACSANPTTRSTGSATSAPLAGTAAAGQSSASTVDAGGGSTVTHPAGPKGDFLTKADAICQASSDRMDDAYTSLPASASDNDFAAFVRTKLVPEWQAMLQQLQAVTPAPGEEAVVKKFWTDLAAGYAAVAADPVKAFHQDNPLDTVNQAMSEYGFQVCGGSIDTAG